MRKFAQDFNKLEYAVLNDKCSLRIYRSYDKFLRIVKVIGNNEINSLKSVGINITLMKALIDANNYLLTSKTNDKIELLIETTKTDSNLDLWILNGNKLVISNINNQVNTAIVHYDGRVVFNISSDTLTDSLYKADEWFSTKDVNQYCTELFHENIEKQLKKKRN